MYKYLLVSLSAFFLLSASLGFADPIEFPEEELATETVLPVFENQRGVLNRNVITEGRFELGGGAGLALNEPFYNPLNLHLQATYHFSELHAVNFYGFFFMSGLSQYGEQLKTADNLGNPFDAGEAPAPQSLLLANYQVQAFYGKISLAKKSVMNLALVGLVGAGMMGYDSGGQVPALNAGFAQKFYFSKSIALRFDFRLVAFQGPDPTSQDLIPGGDAPDPGDFNDELFFNTYLSAGLVFLL
jgi:outer membrane beta-barrel protein